MAVPANQNIFSSLVFSLTKSCNKKDLDTLRCRFYEMSPYVYLSSTAKVVSTQRLSPELDSSVSESMETLDNDGQCFSIAYIMQK